MKRKLLSLILVFSMCLGLIPFSPAYAQEEEKPLNVVLLDDGSYRIDLTNSRSERQLRAMKSMQPMGAPMEPNAITPENNPDEFHEDWVKTDVAELLMETLGIHEVTLRVIGKQINYSRDYTVKENGDTANGEYKIGESFKVPIPKDEHRPAIFVIFPDGRDSRAAVEAKSIPDGLDVNISFLGHTGVQTKWFGNSPKPNVTAKYTGTSNRFAEFDLPTVDQNSILRVGDRWLWKDHTPVTYLQKVSEEIIRLSTKDVALTLKTTINDETEGQLGTSNYFFKVTGDALYGFTVTSREKVSVDFNAGKGSFTSGQAPATQYTGHSLKLSESFIDGMGPISIPAKSELTVPDAEAGQPENEFKGWSDTENGQVVDMDTYVVEKNTTFYAIYGPKAQGKVNLAYVDASNQPIDTKYQLAGVEYPAEKSGNVDETINQADLDTTKAPKFLGYEVTGVKTDPVPAQGDTAKYTEDGKYTIKFTYKKLADIIPAKTDDGKDNLDATEDVKATYKAVTMKVDGNKGTF